jgi:hypothetical protein
MFIALNRDLFAAFQPLFEYRWIAICDTPNVATSPVQN